MANRNLIWCSFYGGGIDFQATQPGAAESAPQGSKDVRLANSAMQGDREAIRSLLKQHVDVNIAQGDGMTALHWAAYRNDLEMAKMLIGRGRQLEGRRPGSKG